MLSSKHNVIRPQSVQSHASARQQKTASTTNYMNRPQYLGTRDAVAAAEVAADIFVFPPVWSIISLEKNREIFL